MKHIQTVLLILVSFLFPNKRKMYDENGKGTYVNISVKGKAIGTVSNLKDTFL
jgi:hypothetical protein